MPAIVLLGHDHACPQCGPTTVTSGAQGFTVNNRAVACVGDSLGCGATITSGSFSMTIEGKAVARIADSTDHGGSLENGDTTLLVD